MSKENTYQSRRSRSQEKDNTKKLPQVMMAYLYFSLSISALIIFAYSTGWAEFDKDWLDDAFRYLGTTIPVMAIVFLGIIQSMQE